jgi:hypothetical protein
MQSDFDDEKGGSKINACGGGMHARRPAGASRVFLRPDARLQFGPQWKPEKANSSRGFTWTRLT